MITQFNAACRQWATFTFGSHLGTGPKERRLRFLEEALELYQACDGDKKTAKALVEYVFSREKGSVVQEVGGVMVTLGSLAAPRGINPDASGEHELFRCWENVEKIRAKHALKPEELKDHDV